MTKVGLEVKSKETGLDTDVLSFIEPEEGTFRGGLILYFASLLVSTE